MQLPNAEENTIHYIWRKIDKDIDLYKFYLDISIKSALFALGVTGALVSFYFAEDQKSFIVPSLLVPFILNIGFTVLFDASVKAAKKLKDSHERTCNQLKDFQPFKDFKPFDMRPLPSVCRIFSLMYLAVAIGLIILAINGASKSTPWKF